jgi:hypothetical protein
MRQTAVTKLNQEAYSFMPDHPFLVTQTHTAVTLALPAYQSDQSFDITSRSFDEPEVLQENSIQEDTSLPNISTASFTVTYSIIPEGTEKGKEKLVDSLGHTYTKKVSKYFHL